MLKPVLHLHLELSFMMQIMTRQITKLYTTTTGWVRHELTFPADTTGAFTDDNLESLQLGFWLHAGSTFAQWYIKHSSMGQQHKCQPCRRYRQLLQQH